MRNSSVPICYWYGYECAHHPLYRAKITTSFLNVTIICGAVEQLLELNRKKNTQFYKLISHCMCDVQRDIAIYVIRGVILQIFFSLVLLLLLLFGGAGCCYCCWCIKTNCYFVLVLLFLLRYIFVIFFNVVFMFSSFYSSYIFGRRVLFFFLFQTYREFLKEASEKKTQTHLWMRDFDTVADSFNGAQWSNDICAECFFPSRLNKKPVFFSFVYSINTTIACFIFVLSRSVSPLSNNWNNNDSQWRWK